MYKYILPLILIVFIGCGKSEITYHEVNVDGLYTVELPDLMSKTQELNLDASLQYRNIYREIYFMINLDPKEDFNKEIVKDSTIIITPDLKGYTELTLAPYLLLEDAEILSNTSDSIHGLARNKYVITSMEGKTKVYMMVDFIEGEKAYYRLAGWFKEKDRAKHEILIQHSMESFKEIKK